jgi:predicted translin family RNA/ssDNA-binding protein
MEQLFQEFNSTLEAENKIREDVKKITKDIDQISRAMSGLLQTIHNRGANGMNFAVFSPSFNLGV